MRVPTIAFPTPPSHNAAGAAHNAGGKEVHNADLPRDKATPQCRDAQDKRRAATVPIHRTLRARLHLNKVPPSAIAETKRNTKLITGAGLIVPLYCHASASFPQLLCTVVSIDLRTPFQKLLSFLAKLPTSPFCSGPINVKFCRAFLLRAPK